MAGQSPGDRGPAPARDLDLVIARLLTIGTYASIAVLTAGLIVMIAGGISPLAAAPAFDAGRLVGDFLAGRAAGFLWVGLLVVIATPTARVVAALIGFGRSGEREMAAVAAAILGVIVLSVILARLLEP